MTDSTAPRPIAPTAGALVLAELAAIPEEEVWLASQKSARTRRAYRQDVAHFMRVLGITTPAQLRQVDHRAVIAWERTMRETERAAASTVRRRLSALSSLFKHLVRHGAAARNPVVDVTRPVINREEGSTAAFSKAQARQLLDAPSLDTIAGLRDRAILSVGLQVGLRRAEIAALTVGDLHQNRGFDSLRVTRKGGRREALAINPQAAARIRAYLAQAGHAEDHDGPMFRASRPARSDQPAAWLDPDTIDRVLAAPCRGDRARSRLLGAFDAGDLHHHGARERRSARGRAEGGRAPRSLHHQARTTGAGIIPRRRRASLQPTET